MLLLTSTLSPATISSSGKALIGAHADQMLAPASVVAAAIAPIAGAAGIDLGAATASAAVNVIVTAAAVNTLGSASVTAAAARAVPINKRTLQVASVGLSLDASADPTADLIVAGVKPRSIAVAGFRVELRVRA